MALKDKDKFVFKSYDKKFVKLYRKERSKLIKILPNKARVEHIGSTAVPGLAGKGIIDILVGVDKKEINKVKNSLSKHYNFIGEKSQRMFFDKTIIYKKRKRFIHIHVAFKNSSEEKIHLLFRDYFRKHPREAKKYAEIKKKAAKHAKGDRDKYLNYKNRFMERIKKKIMAY